MSEEVLKAESFSTSCLKALETAQKRNERCLCRDRDAYFLRIERRRKAKGRVASRDGDCRYTGSFGYFIKDGSGRTTGSCITRYNYACLDEMIEADTHSLATVAHNQILEAIPILSTKPIPVDMARHAVVRTAVTTASWILRAICH